MRLLIEGRVTFHEYCLCLDFYVFFFVEAAFFARTVHVMCKSLVLSLEVLFFVWKRIESDRKPWLDSVFLSMHIYLCGCLRGGLRSIVHLQVTGDRSFYILH